MEGEHLIEFISLSNASQLGTADKDQQVCQKRCMITVGMELQMDVATS